MACTAAVSTLPVHYGWLLPTLLVSQAWLQHIRYSPSIDQGLFGAECAVSVLHLKQDAACPYTDMQACVQAQQCQVTGLITMHPQSSDSTYGDVQMLLHCSWTLS